MGGGHQSLENGETNNNGNTQTDICFFGMDSDQ